MKLKNLFTPAEKLWERGGESMQANSDEEALAYFNQALAKDPHNAKYLTAVGQVSIKLRKWNDARLHLELARKIAPTNPWPLLGLGNVCAGERKFEESIRIYDQLLALEPENDVAWYCKALSLADLRRFDEGLLAVEKCLQLDPDLPNAETIRSRILDAMSRVSEGTDNTKEMTYSPGSEECFTGHVRTLSNLHDGAPLDQHVLAELKVAAKELWDADSHRGGAQAIYWWLDERVDASDSLTEQEAALLKAAGFMEQCRSASSQEERIALMQGALIEAKRAQAIGGASALHARLAHTLGPLGKLP